MREREGLSPTLGSEDWPGYDKDAFKIAFDTVSRKAAYSSKPALLVYWSISVSERKRRSTHCSGDKLRVTESRLTAETSVLSAE